MSTYAINTAQDNTGVAPADHRWSAWFGDDDDKSYYGWGETEAAAIIDLLANIDAPWEPR